MAKGKKKKGEEKPLPLLKDSDLPTIEEATIMDMYHGLIKPKGESNKNLLKNQKKSPDT